MIYLMLRNITFLPAVKKIQFDGQMFKLAGVCLDCFVVTILTMIYRLCAVFYQHLKLEIIFVVQNMIVCLNTKAVSDSFYR